MNNKTTITNMTNTHITAYGNNDNKNINHDHVNRSPTICVPNENVENIEDYSLFLKFYELVSALSKFGTILIYFFICDRTVLFMKANKGYTKMSFLLPVAYCLILGAFFTGPTKHTKINNLDLTREWKGWMQIYLLIYHFTDSYKVTPIYLSARFMVSAYLFLSGFGHFSYFWSKPVPKINFLRLFHYRKCYREACLIGNTIWDVIYRYLVVIYRWNFFAIGLCLIMNRYYMAYYFLPLITFWFTVIVLVMILFPRVSGKFESDPNKVLASSSPSRTSTTDNVNKIATDTIKSETVSDSQMNKNQISPEINSFKSDETKLISTNYLKPRSNHNSCKTHCFYPNTCSCLSSSSSDTSSCSGSLTSPLSTQPSSSIIIPMYIKSNANNTVLNNSIWKRHQKTLSLGTGYDLQNKNLLFTKRSLSPDNHLLSLFSFSSNNNNDNKYEPPWTEDLIRKFKFILPPLNNIKREQKCIKTELKYQPPRLCYKLFRLFKSSKLINVIMLYKFILLFVIIELLFRSQISFHWLFYSGPQKYLFQYEKSEWNEIYYYHHHQDNIDKSPNEASNSNNYMNEYEWYFRWSMDRFSAIFGMLFAFLCEICREWGLIQDQEENYFVNNSSLKTSDEMRSSVSINESLINYLNLSSTNYENPTYNTHMHSYFCDNSSNQLVFRKNNTVKESEPSNNIITTSITSNNFSNTTDSSAHINYSSTVTTNDNNNNNVSAGTNITITSNITTTSTATTHSGAGTNTDQIKQSNLTLKSQFSSFIILVLGIVGSMVSLLYLFACRNRSNCVTIHTFGCLIPIISYICIRNSYLTLRRNYSVFFAWIGDIALELFIAQYHIWLSADAYGILVLLPGYTILNLTLTSFIYICICHEMHNLTIRLQSFIIPNSPIKLLRNILIFGLIFYLFTDPMSQIIQLTPY